jgi:hypothetical protein
LIITALAQTNVGNRARVDGGGNIDTLTLDGGGLTLDLTNISNARVMLLALMVMVSLPAPALKTSIPPLPIRMSSPMPATNISSSLAPVRVLLF